MVYMDGVYIPKSLFRHIREALVDASVTVSSTHPDYQNIEETMMDVDDLWRKMEGKREPAWIG